jgi:hypothetical protein
MAILGKVAGPMLRDNLVRNGVDLIIDSNLAYFDVHNRRVGINTTLPAYDFQVNGNVQTTGLLANNAVISGNLTIPVGNNSNYPAVAVSGQMRFNSQQIALEYYDGTSWAQVPTPASSSNQISSDFFYGDNVKTNFTLSQNSTTQGSLVSVNGVLQQPGNSYTITGNVLSFSGDIPVNTDVIEVRSFTVNSQVGKISNGTNNIRAEYIANIGTITLTTDRQNRVVVNANSTVVNNNLTVNNRLIGNTISIPDSITSWAPLDLTKVINIVTSKNGGTYLLANGQEGQILYLVAGVDGYDPHSIQVQVASLRHRSDLGGVNMTGNVNIRPFVTPDTLEQFPGVVTCIFANGAWNFSDGAA